MSKQVIACVLILAALSSAVVQSKKSVSSYGKNEEISPRIVNGSTARQGQYPWSMAFFHWSKYVCMAALITPKTALTASHCFYKKTNLFDGIFLYWDVIGEFHGKIGDNRLSYAKVLNFDRIILHEDFDYWNHLNDIALIILGKRVELSERIKTIAFHRNHMNNFGAADVAGWGSCSNGPNLQREDLQVATLDIMDSITCANRFKIALQKKTYICTWAEMKGPCVGDGGASLISRGGNERISIGVLIGGLPGTSMGFYYFTNTSYYADWIYENGEL